MQAVDMPVDTLPGIAKNLPSPPPRIFVAVIHDTKCQMVKTEFNAIEVSSKR